MTQDLSKDADIDFAAVELDYEGFRQLARNPNLDAHERIGFPSAYREGAEDEIFADILVKLPGLTRAEGLRVVDIGPGCAGLPRRLIELCTQRRHHLILCDSEEMLAQLPNVEGVICKVSGLFPRNLQSVVAAAPQADAILCYSVLHYIYIETNLFSVFDAIAALLAPGGRALVGDIPNISKRRRFFASEAGRRFHQAFTGHNDEPELLFNAPVPGKIDDAVLNGAIQRLQAAGLNAYLTPQADGLPMANRRDDLLIMRP